MRFMPDKDEALALGAVWMVWPALHLAGCSIAPLLGQLGVSLPWSARLAIEVSQANARLIPSLIGTGCIVIARRFARTSEIRRFLCHLITFFAFGFTVATMLCWLALLREIR